MGWINSGRLQPVVQDLRGPLGFFAGGGAIQLIFQSIDIALPILGQCVSFVGFKYALWMETIRRRDLLFSRRASI